MKTATTPRTHDQVWRILCDKYAGLVDEYELKRIHRKWRSLGKLSQIGDKYQ